MAYGDLKVNNLIYDTGSGDASRSVVSIPLSASPTFTGTPAAPTAAANTNTTQIATTAFVMTELADYAPLAAPAFTGTATGVNLTLSGNLTVNGTTTTIDTTTLDVEDKNITLGKVSSPSDTTADGGGITLKGATDKTITWTNATDTWDFNQNISIINPASSGDAFLNIIGGEGGASVIEFKADEGDDNADYWRVQNAGDGILGFRTKASGSWVEEFRVETTGITVNGSVTDDKGDVRKIPANVKTSAYTLIASDMGKTIYISSGGVTIPQNILPDGAAVTIINNSGADQTITQGSSVNLYNAADASTGNRTLAQRGMATVWFYDGSNAYISGAGLS